MGNFLQELGLGFFMEDQDAAHGLIADVCQNGKVVKGYYGLPYINHHYEEVQIVARIGKTEDGGLEFKGFDAHCDSMSVWTLRVVDKLPPRNEDDITEVRLLTKSGEGHNFLHVDVLNGDILPSFKENEIISLQVIAFAGEAGFYSDEDDYSEHAGMESNGKKYSVALNTIFPVGLFSDDEGIKDVVQIVAEIKKMRFGHCKFGDNDGFTPYYRFDVDTSIGGLVIVVPAEYLVGLENKDNIAPGKIISCFARLSGDAAVLEHENGIVRDAENNLKLVAYTLEDGDPERLSSVLADNFIYHSDSSGKDFSDINEYIEFAKFVHQKAKPAHTEYATITEIAEGEGDPEYSVGTRCAVIRYEGEEGYDAIIFVDTDDEGNISRILLSREGRYRFTVDEPLPGNKELEEMIAAATYKTSIIGRAHFHDLIEKETEEAEIDQYIADHRDDLEADLSDLFNREIMEDVFAEAFLRGVRKSAVTDYQEENIRALGKQFHKDATLFKSEEVQRETFHDALVLVAAIGRLYKGRWVPLNEEQDAEPAEDRDEADKKRQFNILMTLKQGYETGDFENVEAYLTEKSIFESQWVLEPLTGKTDIMAYLRGKGETLKKRDALCLGTFVITPERPILRLIQGDKDSLAIVVELDEEGMAARIDLCDLHLLVDESCFEQE